MWSIGIDIGGTFTDVVVRGRGADHRPQGPHHPRRPGAAGSKPGSRAFSRKGRLDPGAVERVVHATTLFTNTLIERKGARTGLITTRGFRDALEIGRERKYELYDLTIARPAAARAARPAARGGRNGWGRTGRRWPRSTRRSLDEAMSGLARFRGSRRSRSSSSTPTPTRSTSGARGPASRSGSRACRARDLVGGRAGDPRVRAALDHRRQRLPDAPRGRATSRGSAERVAAHGIGCRLLLMLSSGGLTDVDEARRFPVRMLESGPAAGAIAAAWFGAAGRVRATCSRSTWEGTTAKLCLVDGGRAARHPTCLRGPAGSAASSRGAGCRSRSRPWRLIEIGAGGGSIAFGWMTSGLLKVGPESAGSEPGPACYGRGGREPDGHRRGPRSSATSIPPSFAGGSHAALSKDAARSRPRPRSRPASGLSGARARVGRSSRWSPRTWRARRGSTSRSAARDPRRCVLLATGGAGPVHAWYGSRRGSGSSGSSARRPRGSPRRSGSCSRPPAPTGRRRWPSPSPRSTGPASKRRSGASRGSAGRCWGTPGSTPERRPQVARSADLRFRGQDFELVVALPEGPYAPASEARIAEAFRRRLRAGLLADAARGSGSRWSTSGSRPATGGAEAGGGGSAPRRGRPRRREPRGLARGPAPRTSRRYGRAWPETPVFDRYALRPGDCFPGPAIVEERESTAVVGPDGQFEIDGLGRTS